MKARQTQKSIKELSHRDKSDYLSRQFQVASALMSVIPILAFFYLISNTMGLQAFVISRTLVVFIVIAALLGMLIGRTLILNLIRQLDQSNMELGRASEMKTAFLRNVAHEAGTPLATVRANLEALKHGLHGELAPAAQTAVAASLRQTERLLRMVNDLLDIAQIERGKLPMRYARVDLTAVLREALEVVGFGREASKDRFRIAAPLVPRWLEKADHDRILQVIVNLLKNAEKYSPEGTPVIIDVAEKSGVFEVSVADRGDGIPPEFREKIFEPFVRNTERKVGGVGLGLAISRHISAEHGGLLWAEENAGGGSVFRFSIPKSHSVEAASPPPLRAA